MKLFFFKYRTRAIITRGLYINYLLFGSQKRFFKEVFSENYVLMYGLYSRAVSNQELDRMVRQRQLIYFDRKN